MKYLFLLGLVIPAFALSNWVVMLAIGGVHSSIEAVPALGYWATLPFTVLLGVIQSGFQRG